MGYGKLDHTFVVCAYGENPFLEQSIESIESQTELGHILVVTSTPNSHIEGICTRHGLECVVNQGPASISLDWNFGFDQAKTPLVTIVHQDDVYEPGFLEHVLAAFEEAESPAGLVHTDYYEIRDGVRVDDNRLLFIKRKMNSLFAKELAVGDRKAKLHRLGFGSPICCPSVTFDKRVVGPSVFDTRYSNSCDYQTWVNLASREIGFAYVPKPLMGHRIYAESTTTKNIESNVRSTEDREILESLWPKPIADAIFRLYASGEKSNSQ